MNQAWNSRFQNARLAPWLALCCVFAVCLAPWPVQAQIYEQRGQILYEKIATTVPYTYYYYGRAYTGYQTQYTYKEVLNYAKPDWRQQALTLIDKQKERESYESVLNTLGVQGLLAPKQQFLPQQQQYGQQAAFYPSATGNVLGGFTSYEHTKYGSVTPYDVNKADERAHASADAVTRMTAEVHALATTATQGAIGVQQMNQERLGAIAEWQEMRAMMKERAIADKEKALAERDKLLAEAELMRAMKPPASESVRYSQGDGIQIEARAESRSGVDVGGGSPPTPPVGPPPTPPQPPVPNGPHPGLALAVKFCADCHGGEKTSPDGGFFLDEGIKMSPESYAALELRMDSKAPEYKLDQNGQVLKDSSGQPIPYRMPPPTDDTAPPNSEERRLIVEFARTLVVEPSRR